jgi:hypothetical protein
MPPGKGMHPGMPPQQQQAMHPGMGKDMHGGMGKDMHGGMGKDMHGKGAPMGAPMMGAPMAAPLGMGSMVMAQHPNNHQWYPGRVVAMQQGMIGVDWDDPSLGQSTWVQPGAVRPR